MRQVMVYATLMVWSLALGWTIGADSEPIVQTEVVYQHPKVLTPPDGTVVDLAERVGGPHATQIALSVTYEAQRSGLDPNLILGIIRTENPWLLPDTVNWYGAVGLMQVVGWLHDGEFPECGPDLTEIYTNVCYGVRIFERKLERAGGNIPLALLFYNGCWGETYQPGCEVYPDHVTERGEI